MVLEGTVHASTLTDLFDLFDHIYSLPQANSLEEKSDDNPFILEGINSNDFDHLLKYMYHK